MTEAREKIKERLNVLLQQDCCVAFSGGTDSSLLLSLAKEAADKNGTKVYAVTMVTMLHPAADQTIARRVAEELGVFYQEIQVDELAEADIEYNPKDRCYRCKKLLFSRLCTKARKYGCGAVLDGTNGDDLHQYRPGLRAIRELGIISPFAEAGLTKAEVRKWASDRGISVSDRPASPCMATRIPYGERITKEILERIEKGEAFMREAGFAQVRLRAHGPQVRIEVDPDCLETLLHKRECVVRRLKELGFTYITMDLQGFRSGSMDE